MAPAQMERVRIRLQLNMDLVAQKLNGLPRLKVIKAISDLLGCEALKARKASKATKVQLVRMENPPTSTHRRADTQARKRSLPQNLRRNSSSAQLLNLHRNRCTMLYRQGYQLRCSIQIAHMGFFILRHST